MRERNYDTIKHLERACSLERVAAITFRMIVSSRVLWLRMSRYTGILLFGVLSIPLLNTLALEHTTLPPSKCNSPNCPQSARAHAHPLLNSTAPTSPLLPPPSARSSRRRQRQRVGRGWPTARTTKKRMFTHTHPECKSTDPSLGEGSARKHAGLAAKESAGLGRGGWRLSLYGHAPRSWFCGIFARLLGSPCTHHPRRGALEEQPGRSTASKPQGRKQPGHDCLSIFSQPRSKAKKNSLILAS